jgi:hypothetical protein
MRHCHALPNVLMVKGNTQGLGNRIGWYLTAAAVARALDRPVYTSWPNAVAMGLTKQGNRDYDYRELARVVRWPRALKFLEEEGGPANQTSDPHMAKASAKALGSTSTFLRLPNGTALRAGPIPFHPRPYVNDCTPTLCPCPSR